MTSSPGITNAGDHQGRAFVYELSPSIQQTATLTSGRASQFGAALGFGINGELLLVGSFEHADVLEPADGSDWRLSVGILAAGSPTSFAISRGSRRAAACTVGRSVVQIFNRGENTMFSAPATVGTSASLSDDGLWGAFGASGDATNATGINPARTDQSAEDSGAVYLYRESR